MNACLTSINGKEKMCYGKLRKPPNASLVGINSNYDLRQLIAMYYRKNVANATTMLFFSPINIIIKFSQF